MKPKQFKTLADLKEEVDAYIAITGKKFKKKEDLPAHLVFKKQLDETITVPSSDKNSKTKKKFKDHQNYKELVNKLNYPNGLETSQLDTWYGDTLYGRIDYNKNLVYHNYWIFQNISADSNICVFDFVADAFEEMKNLYDKKKKDSKSVYLKELVVVRGNSTTISPEIKYQNYINQKFIQFLKDKNKELKVSKTLKNFNDFKNIFVNYLKEEEGKLTFAGFFSTLETDIYDSYLAFDIYDDRNNPSDVTKIKFLEDPNYAIYEKAARQSGFIIDQNKPWRLIADLESKPIVLAMRRRLKVAEQLLSLKTTVLKAVNQAEQIKSKGYLETAQNYPVIFFKYSNSTPAFAINLDFSVTETKQLLSFADYFRKEFQDFNLFLKNYRDIVETYLKNASVEGLVEKKIKNDSKSDYKIDYGSGKKTVDVFGATIEVPTNLFKLAESVLNLSFIISEEKERLEFIFQSLEAQIKVLQPINKPIEKITIKDSYDAVYSQISDYAFFTYLPKKLEEFYYNFIFQEERKFYFFPRNSLESAINKNGKFNFNNFNSYVDFSKTGKNETKQFYAKRQTDLSSIKTSDGLLNDFYKFDFLIDYLDYRLFEKQIKINDEIKNQISKAVGETLSKHFN